MSQNVLHPLTNNFTANLTVRALLKHGAAEWQQSYRAENFFVSSDLLENRGTRFI